MAARAAEQRRAVASKAVTTAGDGAPAASKKGKGSKKGKSKLRVKVLKPPWLKSKNEPLQSPGTMDSATLASNLKRRSKALGIALPNAPAQQGQTKSKWSLVRARLQSRGGSGEELKLKRQKSKRNILGGGGGGGGGDDSFKAVDDDSIEEARKRFERNAARKERMLEEELEEAVDNADGAAQMVDVLNASRAVQKRRRYFSFRSLANQLVAYLVMVALIVVFTPIAWDHGAADYAWYRTDMIAQVEDSFSPHVSSADEWWSWFDVNILLQPPAGNYTPGGVLPCSSPPDIATLNGLVGSSMSAPLLEPSDPSNLCINGVARMLGENLVVGGIRVAVGLRALQACPSPDFISNTPVQCVARDDDADEEAEDNTLHWDMSSGDVAARRAAAHPHRTGGPGVQWMSRLTRKITIDLTLYNPNLAVLVALQLETKFSSKGTAGSSVDFASVDADHGRFPPSVAFAIGFALILLVLIASLAREYLRVGLRRFIRSGWTWVDIASTLLCGFIIAYDIVALLRLDDLNLDINDTATVARVRPLFEVLLQGGDLVAVMILLMAARVIKYLRIIPYWGPMVVAVVMTWLDPSVVLYLGVTIGLTAAMAVAFLVAFGTQVPEFSSIADSTFTLFTMNFAEDWHEVEGATFRSVNTIFYLFYVVFAVVLLNLFIGIVTDVYPKARQKSQQEWENLITDLMQEEILRRKANLAKPAGGSLLARVFPCFGRWCVSRDYAVRMAKLAEDRRAGRVGHDDASAAAAESVPGYLSKSKRLLTSVHGTPTPAAPVAPPGAVPFPTSPRGSKLATPLPLKAGGGSVPPPLSSPRSPTDRLPRKSSLTRQGSLTRRKPVMLGRAGKSRSDTTRGALWASPRPSVRKQTSMKDLMKAYESKRKRAQRCTTLCGGRIRCCECWVACWRCSWLPWCNRGPELVAPVHGRRGSIMGGGGRRGSATLNARRGSAHVAASDRSSSGESGVASWLAAVLCPCREQRARANASAAQDAPTGVLGSLRRCLCCRRGTDPTQVHGIRRQSSRLRPPGQLLWDAGQATFAALEQLVTTMVTTSVPDASGKDVDAAAGKASATNVDLYRTHLHLRGAPGVGRRGSVLRAVRRKSSAMTHGGSSILRNLQRMGSVKSRLKSAANLTGADAQTARAMGEIQTIVMAQQDALGQRMALLETTLDDIKQMMATMRGHGGHGHHRRSSQNSLAHGDAYPSSHSIESHAVHDSRRDRSRHHGHTRVTLSRSGTRGHRRGNSNGGSSSRAATRGGLRIDTASLVGVADDFTGRSPMTSAGGRSSDGRRASFSNLPTVTPRVNRDQLRERLNRSHEVSAAHLLS